MSIRSRLVILALLTVVPLMFDRVRLLEATRTERIDDAADEALELARRGADGQREVITTARAISQVMARAYIAMMARGETCNYYLADFAGNMPWLNGMSIAGPDGRLKCSTNESAIGLDLSDRPHYKAAQETRDFVVSNFVIGRVNKRPAMVIAYPTQAIDESVHATVLTSVDLQWVSGLIDRLERRPGSTVLFIDGSGTILAGDNSVASRFGMSVSDSKLLREVGDRDEGTVRIEGLDGTRRVFGFVRIPSSDARLFVGLNEADVLSRIDREIALAYVQLAFFGVLVLLLAWFGGERLIVEPIRSLARTATRFGNGDLRVRNIRAPWAKEFVPLTAALNDMAQKLAERERELREANRHLTELASIDALSGLSNRRGFDDRLAAEWQRAAKLGRAVALLMIDVDHFKLFNDRYGHVEGDICLRRIAKLVRDTAAADDDMSARYGGEEFALLMPGADVDAAQASAERLRQQVEALHIVHTSSPCGQVTVSIGVASLVPRPGKQAEVLIEAADMALYAAKRRGRNAVIAHDPVELAEAS